MQNDKHIYMDLTIYEGYIINYLWLIVGVNRVGCEAHMSRITTWMELTVETCVIKVYTVK